MTVQLDLQQLRGIAEKATPGPWTDGMGTHGNPADGPEFVEVRCSEGQIAELELFEGAAFDAAFIATFDPPTVTVLLDRLEQAEKTVEQLQAHRDVLIERRDEWMHRADAAEKGLAEIANYASNPMYQGDDGVIDSREVLGIVAAYQGNQDRAVTGIPRAVRAELDETPEWWDRQYRALIRKQIPRDHASHDGHRVHEYRTYGSSRVRAECIDCRVALDDYEEGTE